MKNLLILSYKFSTGFRGWEVDENPTSPQSCNVVTPISCLWYVPIGLLRKQIAKSYVYFIASDI